MREYNLNPDAARAGDTGGGRIDVSGAYVGIFTRAESVTASKGTEGIELSFKSENEESADFLSLWTHNKDGVEIYGYKVLQAVMTCMKARNIKPTRGAVEKWENGQKITSQATIYPDLTNKKIGLVLQREEYVKNDGNIGSKMNIVGAFDAESRLTASEILDRKAVPERLDKIISSLKDKVMKPQTAPRTVPAPATEHDFDDDIPW